MVGRGKDSVSKVTKCHVWNGGMLSQKHSFCVQYKELRFESTATKKTPYGVFLVIGQGWIRTTVPSREQIYSLSPLATRPPTLILFSKICLWRDLNSWPLPYQGSALPLRHKGSMPQGLLIKKAGNRNRTYNLRFTKPLLYRWAIPATELIIIETNFIVNIFCSISKIC